MKGSILKYAKNLTTYFGASIIPMLLGLVTNPLIASNMSPEDYAITGYYTSFNSLLQPIIVFYMVHYFIKEFYRRNEQERAYLFALIAKALIWFSGAISILCFIGVLIYVKYIAADLSIPISPYLAMAVFSLPFCGLYNLVQARHRIDRKASSFFRLTLISGVLGVALNVLFVVIIKWGAFGKLVAPLITNISIFSFLLIKYKKEIFTKTRNRDIIAILNFCWPLALSATLGYFTTGFDKTYLESIGNNTTYGYYIVGASIAMYLNTFSTAIGNTFTPDLYQSVIQKNWSGYAKFIMLDIGLIILIVLLFIILAPYIIDILTAGRYLESTPFAKILALSTITSSIYYIINNYSITTNRPKLYLYTSISGSVMIVTLMPVMVNNFDYYGGAWMSVLSFASFSIINLALIYFSFLWRKKTSIADHSNI